MVRSVGAIPERTHTPASARQDTLRAVVRALSERNTVVLSLPTDVQDAASPGTAAPLFLPRAPAPVQPNPRALRALADALEAAERPLVLAGRGAVVAGAEQALAALAAFSGALIATSVCGHGLFADDPWCLGISGGFGSPAADALIRESDLILGFGVSFTPWTTKRDTLLAAGAIVAQIDVEPGRLGRHTRVDHALLGDARITAEALLAELARRQASARRGWRDAATRQRLEEGSNHNARYLDVSSRACIDPRTLSKVVDAILPKERVVASDSGHFCGWVPRFLRVPNARASCLSHSFQSVGLGLASVIGLALANPGMLAVLGAGDGGFLMSISDLETAVRLKLRLCILVYNDSSYAAEVHLYRRRGYDVDVVQFPETDFAAIARGFGCRAATVRTLDDFAPVHAWVGEGCPGVFLIDAKISRDLEADWHAEHFPA
jgi:thiamine pyrophosphate-dependent acetolactate synthase large subunit-like protein